MKAILNKAIFKDNHTIYDAITKYNLDASFDLLLPDEPCLVMTSIQHANRIVREGRTNVGMWYYPKQYAVSTWMPHYHQYMLNSDGYFLPLGCIHSDDNLFIKSNSGEKQVTGQLATKDNLDFVKSIEYPETLMFLSSRKLIPEIEWRFWIANREVIGYTPYSWERNISYVAVPSELVDLANCLAKEKWQPDLTYVADLVMVNGEPKLVEINSTTTSGVYGMDMTGLIPKLLDLMALELSGELSFGEYQIS